MSASRAKRADEIATCVLDVAFDLHTRVGNGLREHHYQLFMEHGLQRRGLRVAREVRLDVSFEAMTIPAALRCDLIVEDEVAIELKARPGALDYFGPQVLSYILHGQLPLGYIINFREARLMNGIRRYANTPAIA